MEKMKKTFFIWGIIVIVIFGLLTWVGIFRKGKINVYKELENRLVDAEKKYVDAKFLYPNNGDSLKISAKEMMEHGFLNSMEINNETCEGYATIEKKSTVFEYKGYIKCKNYTTKGYEK